MPIDRHAKLSEVRRFDQLVAYLRDEMDWPIGSGDFEDLTFEYSPEELGIDALAQKTREALEASQPSLVERAIEGSGDAYLMLDRDVQRLRGYTPVEAPYVFLLPGLDPYVMGYRDRGRFLAPEHRAKVFDRAGNAVPTVWVNGQVVGAWGQRKEDGSVVYGLFESVEEEERVLLEDKRQQLEGFLAGEFVPPRFRTSVTRALEKETAK